MGMVKPWHIIVLVVVLILLFGAKRLPDAARGLGRSMRILKAETKNLSEEDVDAKADAQHSRQPLREDTIDGETTSSSGESAAGKQSAPEPAADKQRDR